MRPATPTTTMRPKGSSSCTAWGSKRRRTCSSSRTDAGSSCLGCCGMRPTRTRKRTSALGWSPGFSRHAPAKAGTPTEKEIAMENEIMDLDQLASYLMRDARELSKMANRGHLPAQKVGGTWRFASAEINHWVETQMHAYTEQELTALEAGTAR